MEQFKHIGVIGRPGSDRIEATLKRLCTYLLGRGAQVVLEEPLTELMPDHGLDTCTRDKMGEVCDLVIVVGGDGSLLGAARALAKYQVPVLGVNRGRLGFLTDISPDQLEEQLDEVLDGRYIMESRFLLKGIVRRDGKEVGRVDALNEVVLHPGKATRMIEFEVFIDGQFVYSQRSDGLIISTPTGSTAYSLSGGGPIMHPRLNALVLVPMFPHTLGSRPLVVDGNSEIKLVISHDNEDCLNVSSDGQELVSSAPGDTVTIRKKNHKLRLIHPLDHNYYEICRSKLGWGHRLGD
ncbi:NAD(+) kinase [Endozoicomonadaceae bacterium StTr2]